VANILQMQSIRTSFNKISHQDLDLHFRITNPYPESRTANSEFGNAICRKDNSKSTIILTKTPQSTDYKLYYLRANTHIQIENSKNKSKEKSRKEKKRRKGTEV